MVNDSDERFGAQLRRLRERAGLTQEALAARAGLTAKGVAALESGARRRPYPHTVAALAAALALDAAERAAFAAAARPAAPPPPEPPPPEPPAPPALFQLPAALTGLIGRRAEAHVVGHLLLRPDVRLLTLAGPGGTGKTRLALHVAAAQRESFADGVCFVALAPIGDPGLVPTTIAQALGLVEPVEQPPEERLRRYLRARELLLVLDNFEQILPAAGFLSGLLAEAPRLKLLVTSRALLGVYGEHTFAVPPLLLPDRSRALPAAELLQSEAVRLFVERAQAVQAGFALTDENAAAVAEICHRLDGLPLAIELAAARVRMLPPAALLSRLSQRLRLLTGGASTLPARQQTLRGTLDWSYELLDPTERGLFARMGVFVGGCTLATAEDVCGAPEPLAAEILDGVQSILDKSLIQAAPGRDGEPRYLMLETIREYALERLEASGEGPALRRAHARHYLALVEAAEREFFGANQQRWFDRMEAELGNIRAALAWSQGDDEGAALGLQIAGLLWRFWATRGHIAEGRAWLGALLARRERLPPAAVWFALHTAGNLAEDQGDLEQAQAYWEECLAICLALGNHSFVGHMHNNLGNLALGRGDFAQAAVRYEGALAMYRLAGNQWAIGLGTQNLGRVLHLKGHYGRAQQLLEESLALMRERGDRLSMAGTLTALGRLAYDRAAFAAARACLDEARDLYRSVDSKPGEAAALGFLGELAWRQGDPGRAAALLEQSLAQHRELGNRPGLAHALLALGQLAADQGDGATARRCYRECLPIQRGFGRNLGLTALLEACAATAWGDGRGPAAARLLGAAAALRQAFGVPAPRPEQLRAEAVAGCVRDQLGRQAFEAAWRAGQGLAWEQAIALAQEVVEEPPAPAQGRERPAPPRGRHGLTQRELEVLRLVAQGLSDAEVAARLVISPRTVNGHLSAIYGKLGVTSRTAAARLAIDERLI